MNVWENEMSAILRTAVLSLATLILLSACGGNKAMVYTGTTYPPTDKVEYAFLASQVPSSCRVFAHLLVTLPANSTGKTIKESLSDEARMRGADMILIGQSRQMKEEQGLNFLYYGPEREYRCNEKWCGWKYGYDFWEQQGDWVNIGLREWGNAGIRFDYPLVLQAAFLRCR